jgi:hypothetical protein
VLRNDSKLASKETEFSKDQKRYKHGEKKQLLLNDKLFHLRNKPFKTFEKSG